jgi:hypothetical protein
MPNLPSTPRSVMNVYALLRHAVLNKQVVVGTYRGHRREFCPHILGSWEGEPRVFVYQFSGGSERGIEPGGSNENWRCFVVDDLENVSAAPGPWRTASNYTEHADSCMDSVDVRAP